MTSLTAAAQETLRAASISPAEWVRSGGSWPPRPWQDGEWHGDECGCTDDRCIGYHHDGNEECGCLPALIEEYQRDQRAEAIWDNYRAAVEDDDRARSEAAMAEAEGWVRDHYPHAESFSLDALVNDHPGISIIEHHDREPMRVPGWAPTAEPGKYRNLVWSDNRHPRTEYSTPDWDAYTQPTPAGE